MMRLKIAICDDEKNIRENLACMVKAQCSDCEPNLYSSGNELLAENKEYDIYFLDIQMPGMNGMKVAKQLRKQQEKKSGKESLIIFITALAEFMEDAFDVRAFHYLLKPVDENKFKIVFSRAIDNYLKSVKNEEKHILVKSKNSYHKIYLKDILYAESHDKKVIIHLADDTMEYYGKMRELESRLGKMFFRCHRCYIINMEHVVRYNSDIIGVSNNDEIFIAQKKYPEFVKAYMHYIMNEGGGHGTGL